MAGFLDLTGLSRFKSKLLEAIANVYVTKTAHSKALNLKVNKADLESEIKRVLGTLDTGIPVGTVVYAHEVPTGWLQCNGAAVSRTTYAALFAKIGTKYGSGNGSTTFNLPNLHHKFIEGTTTSSEVGKSVSAGLPDIGGHTVGALVRNGTISDRPAGAFDYGETYDARVAGGPSFWASVLCFSAQKSDSTYGSSSTVQPSSLRLMAIIRT